MKYTARLWVFYFPKTEPEVQADDESVDEKESPEKDTPKDPAKKQPKSYQDYIKKKYDSYDMKKPEEKILKGIPVTHYNLTGRSGESSGPAFRVRSAVFSGEEGEYVMEFSCYEEVFKSRHKKDFETSIRSFKRIEKKETQRNDLSSLSANDRYIQEQIDKLSSGWYWFWSRKKNYIIFSNADKVFARKIEKNLEAIHACYVKMFPGVPRIQWIPIVRVCKTKDEYHGYGGPTGSAGYWSDHTKEFVFYDDVARGEKNSMVTLRHEAFHHFIHFYLGCRPSTWFDEGHADYYAGGEVVGTRFKPKINMSRRGTIQSAIVNKKHVALKKLVYMSKKEYYAKASLCYPQGWSFVYFLRNGRQSGAKVKKLWEEMPDLYFTNLQKAFAELEKERPKDKADENEVNAKLSGDAVKMALERTFKDWTDKDWEEMEQAWVDFIS
jgi:hypothetical protein